ncbi:beta-galactosidase [Thalassotalea agariperforans]
MLENRTLIFDNVRLIKNPPRSLAYLENLADQYGQRVGFNSEYDISSDQQLKSISQQELMQLDNKLMADRSTFGGWKNGPKLTATGYFRTEKVNGIWTLVDPEGYLFFSTGIANVRMANTSTITGMDFDKSLIKQRAKGDLTPEDSLGLNPVSEKAKATAYVASDIRRNMFTWLPEYDEPLAKHYGYRRSVHQGALEHGETFSFYQANLERKYGENYIETWKNVTIKRMRNWGFTSFGNWIDPMFYHDNQVPYFANGWIIGNFKTVSSGDDLWSPLPDPFDPLFATRARVTLEQIAEEVKNNPWCVGVFIDNEKSWGNNTSTNGRYSIVINTLRRSDKDSPTKTQFTQLMKSKYKEISALNSSWKTQIDSWQDFSNGVDLAEFTDEQLVDYADMLTLYANEYFSIVKTELKRVLPNHMYMGVRFASWGMTPEIIAAAKPHVDVMSYNIYKEGVHSKYWQFLEQVDMPSIIGEFHMGAMDTGLLNPGLVHAKTQQDRAQQYLNYMNTVVDNPYFVGAHWFQYIDSPLTGRAYDGENYNVGFVNVTDTPYQPMIEAVKGFNQQLYPRRFKTLSK